MADTSRPFGVRPERYLDGSPWNGLSTMRAFAAAQANNAYIGDLVQVDATNRSTALSDPIIPGTMQVKPVVATLTTNAWRGVIAGFVPQPEFNMSTSASLGLRYRVLSTLRYAWIVEDISVCFEAQETGNSWTSATVNGVNKVVDISYTAGNQTTGVSGVVVDASTVVSNAVKPFRILGYTQRVDNFNFTSADTNSFAHLDLMINNSDLFVQGSNGA